MAESLSELTHGKIVTVIRGESLGNWLAKYSGKSFWVRMVNIRKGVLMLTGTGHDYLYLDDFSEGMDSTLRELFGDRTVNKRVKLTESVDFVLVNRPMLGICLGPSIDPVDRAMLPSLRSNLETLGIDLVSFEEDSDLLEWVENQDNGSRFGMIISYYKHSDSYRAEYPHSKKYGTWANKGSFIEYMFKSSVDTERYHWLHELKLVGRSTGIG